MKDQDYHTNITVDATAQQAFESINSVSQWWTENLEGSSQKLNEEFTVRFGETFVTVKIVELIPGRKIVWHVTDCNKPWLKDKKEWKDTKISFEISEKDSKTQINFTHLGLVPGIECFELCSNAWSQYIQQSLWKLVTTGKGQPGKKENKTKDKSKT
jgi:hypothetical protein